jgi:uncharacterized protein YndB with AHSA1/START domain
MFGFEKSILIDKAPHNVFQFVVNPANIPIWRSDISAAKVSHLPIKADDTFEEVDAKDASVSVVRVVEVVPEKLIVFKVMSGGMYLPRRELILTEEDGHTLFTVRISAKSDGFSRWMESTSSQDYSLKWENYLFSLKRVMEDGAEKLTA